MLPGWGNERELGIEKYGPAHGVGMEWNGMEIFKWGYRFYWSTSKLKSKDVGSL